MKGIFKSFRGSRLEHSNQPNEDQANITNDSGLNQSAKEITLIELFQSQGCNSCPPTNQNLINLITSRSQQQSQSGSNPEYLLLTYQVTYWDYLGWSDTFGDSSFDARQRDYVRRMRLQSAYTPMVVVNGKGVGVGNTKGDLGRILDAGMRHNGVGKIDIRAEGGNETGDKVVDVDTRGLAPSSSSSSSLEILQVTYTPESQDVRIGCGENAGRTLPHLNVVKEVKRIGYLERGAQGKFRLEGDAARGKDRVLMVQDGKGGEVLAVVKV